MIQRLLRYRVLSYIVVLLLSSCAVQPPLPLPEDSAIESTTVSEQSASNETKVPRPPPITPDKPAPNSGRQNTASQALLDAAQEAVERGDTSGAVSKIERALRITPRDSGAYFQLAKLRFDQGMFLQASQLAQKALYLSAASEPNLIAAIKRFIADCQAELDQ